MRVIPPSLPSIARAGRAARCRRRQSLWSEGETLRRLLTSFTQDNETHNFISAQSTRLPVSLIGTVSEPVELSRMSSKSYFAKPELNRNEMKPAEPKQYSFFQVFFSARHPAFNARLLFGSLSLSSLMYVHACKLAHTSAHTHTLSCNTRHSAINYNLYWILKHTFLLLQLIS